MGEWKYLDATWAASLAAGNVDKEFKLVVTLNEADHTFATQDSKSENQTKVSFNPSRGGLSFGKSGSSFKGKAFGKGFGFGVGKANLPQNETAVGGPTYQYQFDTEQIKKALNDFLAQRGWQPKKSSFFGKLFG